MFHSLHSRSFAVGVVTGLVLFIGCETTNYDNLLSAHKDRKSKIEASPVDAGEPDGTPAIDIIETPQPIRVGEPLESIGEPTGLSLAEENKLVGELERLDVYFVFDGDGYVTEVDLKECRSSNEALAKVVDFSRLSRVLLEGGRTDSATYDHLAKIRQLAYLDLERSSPSASDFEKLKGLPKLTFLQLFKATLDDEGMKVLSKFPALEQIRCAQTRVGDDELQHLANLKTLKAIDLSDCNRVSPTGLEYLAQCPKLSFLKVWGKGIGDQSMETVAKMKSLKVLGLIDTAVGDVGIEKLASLDLREIHLFRTSVGDAGVKVLAAMPNMTTLNLRDTAISDQGLVYIAELKKLKRLDLSECTSPGVTDASAEMIGRIESLEDLNLWSTKITDAGVAKFVGLKNLKRLNLDACDVTDRSVATIGEMKSVEWLHLGKTKITDQAVATLKTLELKYLNVSNTSISQDAYYDLLDALEPNGCEIIGP